MSNYPTVADMLSVIGVAFLIVVVLTALVGVAAEYLGRRRETAHATVTTIPAQREAHEHTHAHAA